MSLHAGDREGEAMSDDAGERGKRLFRGEVVVLEADVRAEIANQIDRTTMGTEEVFLDRSTLVQTTGDSSFVRGSRYRRAGSCTREVGEVDAAMLGSRYEERVEGGVDVRMQVESEAIMAGAYYNQVLGAYTRVAAWADFMAWGGWMEADANRTEISGLAIRSYCLLTHNTGVRAVRATSFCDDFTVRTENFTTCSDNTGSENNVSMPGAGDIMES